MITKEIVIGALLVYWSRVLSHRSISSWRQIHSAEVTGCSVLIQIVIAVVIHESKKRKRTEVYSNS